MEPDTVLPLFAIAKEINVQFVFAYDPAEFAESLRAIAEGEIDVGPADHRRGRARRRRCGIRRTGQTRHALQDPGDALTVGCQHADRSAREDAASLVLAAAGLAVVGTIGLRRFVGTGGGAKRRIPAAVTVVGSGEVQGTPDTLTVNASIEFIAPDVTGAMNQTSDRQKAVIDALVDAGIDRKDISTSQVSLQPQFTGGGDNPQTIVGYRASNSIDVKIRKLDAASQALALIVSHRRRRHQDQQR